MANLVLMLNDLSGPWAEQIWGALWQSAVLAGIILLLMRIRRLSPTVRFWLWMLIPLRLLIMPALTIPLPIFSATPASEVAALSNDVDPNLFQGQTLPAINGRADGAILTAGGGVPGVIESSGAIDANRSAKLPDTLTILMIAWGLGALVTALRLTRSWRATQQIVMRAEIASTDELQKMAAATASTLGLKRKPRVVISNENVSPFVIGIIRPTVVLPQNLVDSISADELAAILTHELAHLRRRDPLLGWIPAICQIFYFFNPIFYIARRYLLLERETACDACVLNTQQISPATYARALVSAAARSSKHTSRPFEALPVVAESFAHLKNRLLHLNETGNVAPQSRVMMVCLLVFAALALPGFRLVTRPISADEFSQADGVTPTREIVVSVTTPGGLPIAGAQIEVLADFRPVMSGLTNLRGLATINVPLGTPVQWVAALKSGSGLDYHEFNRPEQISAGTFPPTVMARHLPALIELTLGGARKISIQARDSAAAPVADVRFVPWLIHLEGRQYPINLSGSRIATVLSDADGNATFDWIPRSTWFDPGTTFLVRSGKYHWPDPPEDLYPSEDDAEVTATLVHLARIRGRIAYPNGRPAAEIRVHAEGRGDSIHYSSAAAVTDANGQYALSVAPEQSIAIAVVNDDWTALRTGISVSEGEMIHDVDLRLTRGTVIQGRMQRTVDNQAVPVAGQVVFLGCENSEPLTGLPLAVSGTYWEKFGQVALVQRTFTDEKGRWSFRVPLGNYLLMSVGTQVTGTEGAGGIHKPYRIVLADDSMSELDVDLTPNSPDEVWSSTAAPMKANDDEGLIGYGLHPASKKTVNACLQCHYPRRGDPPSVHGN